MKNTITKSQINFLKDFLETSILSARFSTRGLTYLALKEKPDALIIDLDLITVFCNYESYVFLLLKETLNFIQTGKHAMPLDFSVFTSFQQRVFAAVKQIEPGEIYTYKELAERIASPNAARAVGTAIAKNPVSYLLPTHRVLPQKGIGKCRSGAGHLREKLLKHEGHDIELLKGNYVCKRAKCCME